MLARIYIIVYKRSVRRRTPAQIRGNGCHTAVIVCNSQIHAHCRTLSPRGTFKVPYGKCLMVIPAVSQHYSHNVYAFVKQRCYVKSYIFATPVIAGVHRVEKMVANFFAVHRKREKPSRRNIRPCRFHMFLHIESFSEIRCRLVITAVIVAYPRPLPVFNAHHAGFKPCHGRHIGFAVFPHVFHAPEIRCERFQRLSCIYHILFVSLHNARAPRASLSRSCRHAVGVHHKRITFLTFA